MLRRAYDWCIDAAYKPYALWLMGLVSFVESSFFPAPPDVMLIPMSLARPRARAQARRRSNSTSFERGRMA
jgi:membrane protein YqaA with SNARE-associated domain